MLLRVFQRQVADQCRLVLTAAPMIDHAASVEDQDALWIGCQVFVVGAGNLSKALWGDGKNRAKVATLRQPLRDSLEVADSSPLLPLAFRNHFEHYDERIDKWWKQSQSHNILDRMIGSAADVVGFTDLESFRIYDPSGPSIVFWGDRFDLQPIANECERIYRIAIQEAAKPHWQSPSASGSGQ